MDKNLLATCQELIQDYGETEATRPCFIRYRTSFRLRLWTFARYPRSSQPSRTSNPLGNGIPRAACNVLACLSTRRRRTSVSFRKTGWVAAQSSFLIPELRGDRESRVQVLEAGPRIQCYRARVK